MKDSGWIILLLVVIAVLLMCGLLTPSSEQTVVVVQATSVPTTAPPPTPIPTRAPITDVMTTKFSCKAVDYTITAVGPTKGYCPPDIIGTLGEVSFTLQDGEKIELVFSQLNGHPSWDAPLIGGSIWPPKAPERFACFGNWDPKNQLPESGVAETVATPSLITCTHGDITIRTLISQVIVLQNFFGVQSTLIP